MPLNRFADRPPQDLPVDAMRTALILRNDAETVTRDDMAQVADLLQSMALAMNARAVQVDRLCAAVNLIQTVVGRAADVLQHIGRTIAENPVLARLLPDGVVQSVAEAGAETKASLAKGMVNDYAILRTWPTVNRGVARYRAAHPEDQAEIALDMIMELSDVMGDDGPDTFRFPPAA